MQGSGCDALLLMGCAQQKNAAERCASSRQLGTQRAVNSTSAALRQTQTAAHSHGLHKDAESRMHSLYTASRACGLPPTQPTPQQAAAAAAGAGHTSPQQACKKQGERAGAPAPREATCQLSGWRRPGSITAATAVSVTHKPREAGAGASSPGPRPHRMQTTASHTSASFLVVARHTEKQ